MGGSNSNVVRRTWGLLQSLPSTAEDKKFAYGDAFDYDEFMQTPSKISALLLSLTIFIGAGLAMTLSPVSSNLMHTRLKASAIADNLLCVIHAVVVSLFPYN